MTEQQSLFLERAGDAGGDGAQQALEFRLCRGTATVQAGPYIVERVGANVAIRNNAGDTPLDLAYKKKSKAAVIAALEAAAR